MKNNKLDGVAKYWTEEGYLINEVEYINGLLHGDWKEYYPSKYDICKKIFSMCGIKKKIPKNFFGDDKYSDQPFKEFTGPF